jgi:hypothetical protein
MSTEKCQGEAPVGGVLVSNVAPGDGVVTHAVEFFRSLFSPAGADLQVGATFKLGHYPPVGHGRLRRVRRA